MHRAGGSANLHYVTGKYGCKKTTLLEFEGGTIFEAEGDLLKLKGGALAVAAAAAAAGRVTRKVGRRKSPQHLLTKAGFATKEDTARYLQRRIEGLLMTAGDGVLQFKAVLRALALQPSHALKRWLPKVGLRSSANGDLWVDPYRLFSFRMYRILEAASFVSEQNGEVSLQDLMEHLYRPPELLKDEEHELTAEARAVAFDMGLAPSPSVEEWRLEARDRYWRKGEASLPALPPPRETVEFREGTLALESEMDRAELSTEAVKFEIVLAEKQVESPLWLEAWIREYFVVEEDKVFLPFLEPWRKPVPRDPDLEPVEVSHVQQEALLMNIQEEMRLRYGRVHMEALGPMFPGARKRWLKRFFDITSYGDVVEKSVARQSREAIAVASRIYYEGYTVTEAFYDFGIGREWLRRYFILNEETGELGLDRERYSSWDPPPKDPEAPNPRIYSKLDAPRGYQRKGFRHRKRKYGHSAGGIIYANPRQK